MVRVLLNGEEALFANIKAEEIVKKREAQERVWQAITHMLKFNVIIEGILAYNNDGVFEIKDTELKQY